MSDESRKANLETALLLGLGIVLFLSGGVVVSIILWAVL